MTSTLCSVRLRKAWVLNIQSTQTTCSTLLAVIFTAKRLSFWMKIVMITHYSHLNTVKGANKWSIEAHLKVMCGRVGSARKMQEILRNCYKLISIWIEKFLGGKKYFTKIKRAGALFFVYNYHLTKPHKCAIINLDPPLGGRRSRNSHYTTSFKKSQIKSHRQITQSFFPKSHSFCAICTTDRPSRPHCPVQPSYATSFVWQPGPGRICPPRR